MNEAHLELLAARHGLGHAYHDYRGELRIFTKETKAALLAAMGVRLSGDEVSEAATPRRLPHVKVVREAEEPVIPLHVAGLDVQSELRWEVVTEEGRKLAGTVMVPGRVTNDALVMPADAEIRLLLPRLSCGYHRLLLRVDGEPPTSMDLIVASQRCFEPPALEQGRRVWGITLQLYTLRSASNWGIGDFGDLCEVIDCAAPLGCALIGLNPLHALLPAVPEQISPYSPSSRQFLNILYIALPRVPEYAESPVMTAFVARSRETITRLRESKVVDYTGVADLKLTGLRLLYQLFRANHLMRDTERAREFRRFIATGGDSLRLHAEFDALHAHLRQNSTGNRGWPDWPSEYRDPASAAVRAFAAAEAESVTFYLYLQWVATTQLADAQTLASARGMALGLYGDVAVGVSSGGSETWSNQKLYVRQAGIGAPPDPLALKGQDWGIPPQNPTELAAQGYRPFIDMLRRNMRSVAALRLDHVMALFRQWWVPRGFQATEGAYVHYPLDDLMSILSLESQRNRCMVIGEDLGTVPDAVRIAMHDYGVAHYKVLLFEREQDGRFKAPESYERRALAAVTTHDLPTFKGWWEGVDIAIASRLDLYPDEATRTRVAREREQDRLGFMRALVSAGLWHWHPDEPVPATSHALIRAAHLYLGLSSAELAVVQIEDLAGMADPVNVPGTDLEYPNWQRKVSAEAPAILTRDENMEMLRALSIARTGRNPN